MLTLGRRHFNRELPEEEEIYPSVMPSGRRKLKPKPPLRLSRLLRTFTIMAFSPITIGMRNRTKFFEDKVEQACLVKTRSLFTHTAMPPSATASTEIRSSSTAEKNVRAYTKSLPAPQEAQQALR